MHAQIYISGKNGLRYVLCPWHYIVLCCNCSKDFAVQELSKKVYGYINRQTPLKDTANTHRQSTETQHK